MGKPKNKSKGQDLEDLSDIEVGEKIEEEENRPATKQSKKEKRKKKKNDEWEDDVASEIASLSLDTKKGSNEGDEEIEIAVSVNKKEKKKKKKQKQEESEGEDEEEIMPSTQKSKKKPGFSMLIMDEEGSDNQMNSPSESEEEVKLIVKQEPAKKKKEKKKQKNQEEDIDALLAEIEKPKEKSAGKKSKKDKKKEALNEDMETEQLNENGVVVEESNMEKTESKVVTMEDLEDEDDKKKKKKKKGKEKKEDFENIPDAAGVDEVEKVESKVVTMEDLEDDEDDKKKKKKKKGKKETIDNTIDNNVTEEVEKAEPKVVTMEDLEDDEEDEKKKKKKKKTKDKDGAEEKEGGEEEEEGGEGTMKTAAQKRKEKKEREKEKKKAEKMKQAQKKDKEKTEEKTVEKEKSEEKEKTPEEEKTDAAAEDKASGDEAEEDGKKKKKDRKKKGEKEEKKDDKKKKLKAPVAAIKEMLKKQKEEEERLKKEEEERIRKEEEAIAAALEKKRIEEERKQRRKEKEKEKRERLKAEGKLLTAQQKADKKRAMQMLEMMKAQGIKVPNKDDVEPEKKKRPVYGVVRKKKKQEQTDTSTPGADSESREDTPTPTAGDEKQEEMVEEKEEKKDEEDQTSEVKEEWDDDVKDEWDASSEEEEEESEEKESSPETETKVQVEIKPKGEVKKAEEEEDSEEDDESDDDNEEEDDDSESEEESETESEDDDEMTPYERAEIRIKKNHEKCESQRTTDNLRAPVVCVLGHVDTGKTKILDKLRRTNVQDGEAGGITQQIGATNVPKQAILDKTTMCKEFQKKELKLPGLLIIDTPGHESFSNLRSRGSSLCDIAILVIDIMHGLEPQTIESINLLKDRKTPFVVALNKIDRLYQWKSNPNVDVVNTIKKQTQMCRSEFDERSQAIIVQLAEQGLNAALFYENKNPKEYISLVPTSAHSGDGMGNLLALICELTQTWLAKKVSYTAELHATVMEVKALPGLGTTIDVILVNGKLCEGDQIVIAGTEGPIVTQIRGLLMPQPMRELRVKAQYEHHKEVMAAQGVKIIGKELEKALAGLPLYVAHNEDEVEYYKEELSEALKDVLGSIKLSERGVFVQASTLGSLEALLEFLRASKIPYAGINIGPVHKKDIMKASIMLEHDSQWAVILAFDVKVERDAQEMADGLGVRIFTADIIYHLEDKFLKFREDLKRQKQEEFKHIAVFPCKLRVLPQFIFNQRDPIVLGVSVEAGIAKVGTPICVPSKEFVEIGTIASIENNHKSQETARRGEEVCVKIENTSGDAPKLYGRHFDHTDLLVSKISRTSIDAVKDHFREEMTKQDWALMVELKKTFQIL